MAKSKFPTIKQFIAEVVKKRKKPYILVEGKDDIAFYENIVESIDRDYTVKPIGRYKDSSNCVAVIEFMQELDEALKGEKYRKYFLGIIDGDARKQKNDFPKENSLLYILQYYSWESYFVNQEVIAKSIKNFLKTRSLLKDELITKLYNENIEPYLLNELWFCALKRLKDMENDNDCNEEGSIDRLDKDKKFIKGLYKELEEFAIEKSLDCNHQTLLEITKGKWALKFFVKKYLQILKKLPILCKYQQIESCDYCKDEDFNNCLYDLKVHYKEENIRGEVINLVDLESLQPIKNRIKKLK